MGFWETYNKYREDEYFIDNFLLNNNIIKQDWIIEEVSLETNHTYDRRESRATAITSIDYYQEIYKIIDIEYGLNLENNDKILDYNEFLEYKKSPGAIQVLHNEFNECKVILEKKEFDNYQKEMSFLFDFQGDMSDISIIDDNSFQIAVEILSFNEDSPYWGKLLIQALHIIDKKQFDLTFLLIFTAFENYINLLSEEYKDNFYKEINLTKMELKNKMKILLKYILNINPSTGREEHPSLSIIERLFSELYEIRNKVAHGGYREVEYEDCQNCLNLFFLLHTTVIEKPTNNNALLKSIKKYKDSDKKGQP